MSTMQQIPPIQLLLRMLRFYVASPHALLWRTIEAAVMVDMAARHGLDLRAHVDLDVGCGNGVLGNALVRDIGVGFDMERTGLVWARHHKPAYRAVLRASAAAIPLRSASRQIVFSNSVIEHIPDAAAALDEIGRVLEPGGFLLLSTVSEQFPALMLGEPHPTQEERADLDRNYAHDRYYSAPALAAELAARGLKLLESASYMNARQARWCHTLRIWEQRQRRTGLFWRLNQMRRAPIGLALAVAMRPLYTPAGQGAGLAVIARRPG
jgi:SAM-dependent methyltransferase